MLISNNSNDALAHILYMFVDIICFDSTCGHGWRVAVFFRISWNDWTIDSHCRRSGKYFWMSSWIKTKRNR